MLQRTLLGIAACGLSMAAFAVTPPVLSRPVKHATGVQGQLQDISAKIAAARSQNTALQAQVTQLEQQNAAQQQQLDQRNAAIAALQQKLRAAGVPASTTSSGP